MSEFLLRGDGEIVVLQYQTDCGNLMLSINRDASGFAEFAVGVREDEGGDMMSWSAFLTVAWVVAATGHSPQPSRKFDLIAYLQGGYAGVKADLTSAAEAMPEADYAFKPTSMPDVRTFGETILHVASAQFGLCARLRGVADEPRQKIEHTNKADVVKTLAASFLSCDVALSSLTDASANELVRQGPVEIPKSAALVGLLAHDAEMYGIATVYLRAKNIVPPSTARQGNR